MPSLIEQAIDAFRKRQSDHEAAQMAEMAHRWMEIENALESRINLLAQQAADMRAHGTVITASRIYQLDHYRKLLAQAKQETKNYAAWAAKQITIGQTQNAQMGIESASAMIRATYLEAGKIGAYFDILPVDAVDSMIGFAGDGTPLVKLLMRDYPETVNQLTRTLIDATASGRNPRETARRMLDNMAGNLNRALTIARTEQLRSYRDASRQQMSASGVVTGYIRRCALSDRTCMACIALDGTEYATDEMMDVHPNDRCFMQPKIANLKPVETITGKTWFEKQPEAAQRAMMGNEKYDLWRGGAFEFNQLASTYVHPEWGPSIRVTPLSELEQ